MIIPVLKLYQPHHHHHHLPSFSISQTTLLHLSLPPPHFPSPTTPHKPTLSLNPNPRTFNVFRVSKTKAPIASNEGEYFPKVALPEFEDLSPNGIVYRKTLALVECSMFAALTGLVYFLSNSLAIEV